MRLVSQLFEAKNEYLLTAQGMEQFLIQKGANLPKNVKPIVEWMKKYKILDKEEVESMLIMSSPKLKALAKTKGMAEDEMTSMVKELKKLGLEKNLLPMFMDQETRQDYMNGDKENEDIMLDLISEKGRAAIVKQYTPLINKIVNQYVGKTSLDKSELLSAAFEGLVCAMNEYRKPSKEIEAQNDIEDKEEAKKKKRSSFLTYASYRMKQKILDDINNYSRTVRIPGSTMNRHKDDEEWQNMGKTTSIDVTFAGSEEEGKLTLADRLAELQIGPEDLKLDGEDAANAATAEKIYNMIENKFNQKHCTVFYKTFGLKGYTMMRPSEVAKEMGLSNANVSMINKRIATFLKTTPGAQPLLKSLLINCMESIFVDSLTKTKVEVSEALRSNDMYILFEDLTKWSEPSVLESSLKMTLDQYDADTAQFLIDCFNQGIGLVEEEYQANKKLFVHFLESLNPTQSFQKKQDLFILAEMDSLISLYQDSDFEL